MLKFILTITKVSILAILLLLLYAAHQLYSKLEPYPELSLDTYHLQSTQNWNNRFDYLNYNGNDKKLTKIQSQNNILRVYDQNKKYQIYYEYEVDLGIIDQIVRIQQQGDSTIYPGQYLIVKYHQFDQIIYFLNNSKQSQICIQVPKDVKKQGKFHIDNEGRIWIVTLSKNKAILIQIYSCIQNKLEYQYRYILKSNQMINKIIKIQIASHNCMNIKMVGYSLDILGINVCPHQKQPITQLSTQLVYKFNHKIQKIQKWQAFSDQIQVMLSDFKKILDYAKNIIYELFGKQKMNVIEYDYNNLGSTFELDTIVYDEQRSQIFVLQRNKSIPKVISLGKHMIAQKSIFFYNSQPYNQEDVIQFLKNIQQKKDIEFIRMDSINQSISMTAKGLFKIRSNQKVQFLGIGQRVLLFYPEKALKDNQLYLIRTKEGALALQGHKIKGSYDKLPSGKYKQIYQRYNGQPAQLMPGLYQSHIRDTALFIKLTDYNNSIGRLDLISLQAAKTIHSHYIKLNSGYKYVSSVILNNQFWVLQYSPLLKVSRAKKYQFYVDAKQQDKTFNLQRIYGDIQSQITALGIDPLADVMKNVKQQYGGYIFLSIYRCIDHYYYIQFTDPQGEYYGVVRVHFHLLSNRRLRSDKKFSGQFQKKMSLDISKFIKSPQPVRVDAFMIKSKIFNHVPQLIHLNKLNQWNDYCSSKNRKIKKLTKYGNFYYIPQNQYLLTSCKKSIQPVQIISIDMRNLIIQSREGLNVSVNKINQSSIKYIIGAIITYLLFLVILNMGKVAKIEKTQKIQ